MLIHIYNLKAGNQTHVEVIRYNLENFQVIRESDHCIFGCCCSHLTKNLHHSTFPSRTWFSFLESYYKNHVHDFYNRICRKNTGSAIYFASRAPMEPLVGSIFYGCMLSKLFFFFLGATRSRFVPSENCCLTTLPS